MTTDTVMKPWTMKEYYNIFKSDRNTDGKFVWQLEDESSNWETIERMVKRESMNSLIFNLTNFMWQQLTGNLKVITFEEEQS